MSIKFDFDISKDDTNLDEHGPSVVTVTQFNWDAALLWIDDRADYGEARMVGLQPLQIASRPGEPLAYEDTITVRSITMPKPLKKIYLKMLTLEEDQVITAAAESDLDPLPLTDEKMSEMVPKPVLRGRPKLANKMQLVSIRYSPEVINYFMASGASWQAHMDIVLQEYVEAHSTDDPKVGLTSRFRRRERMMSPMQKSWPASDLERYIGIEHHICVE